MDDIKPSGSAPAPAPSGAPKEDPPMEELDNVDQNAAEFQSAPSTQEPPQMPQQSSGMKTWVVVVLVVLALIIGGAGVYLWQTSQEDNSEAEALQSQIDELNQDLNTAKENVQEELASGDDAKDAEIKTLTEENATLTAENTVLQESNDTLKAENQALTDACEAATDCDLP